MMRRTSEKNINRCMNLVMHAENAIDAFTRKKSSPRIEPFARRESVAREIRADDPLFCLHLKDLKSVPDIYSIFVDEPSICSLELKFSTSYSSIESQTDTRGLDSRAAKMLVECFSISQCLIHLSLPGNNITDEIIRDLYPGLLQCFQLVDLNLSCNFIGDTGARLLSTLFTEHYCLTSVDLSHNHIGSIGCSHIAYSLNTALCLTELNLSVNRIPDKGAIDLFSCLCSHSIMESVNLSCNRLTDRCVSTLTSLLASNRVLKHIDVSGSDIGLALSTERFESLLEAVNTRVDFRSCGFSEDQLRRLNQRIALPPNMFSLKLTGS